MQFCWQQFFGDFSENKCVQGTERTVRFSTENVEITPDIINVCEIWETISVSNNPTAT